MTLWTAKKEKKTRIFHEKIRIFSMRNIQRIQGLNLTPDIFLLQKFDFTSVLAGDRVQVSLICNILISFL